ncbi:MAG: T9SS type A sorting domain-containing protein [Bacteroidia bacterium]|nr:T9SS type A sorting domain-containing protein [Bacteroidia bacterium]
MRKYLLLFTLTYFIYPNNVLAVLNPPTLSFPSNNMTYNYFEVQFSLSAQNGVSVFQFQYDTTNNFNSLQLKTLFSSTTYSGIGSTLRKSKTYYWRARAINTGDTSTWTSAWSFTVGNQMTLVAPSNNSSGDIKKLQCAYWSYYTSFTNIGNYYLFELDTVNTMNSVNRKYFKSNISFGLDSLFFKFGRKICWRATAINSFGDTINWSSVNTYNVDKNVPVNSISSTTDPEIYMNLPGFGASESIIQFDTSANFNSPILYEKTLQVGITKDTIRNLFFGKKYYYRVRASFNGSKSNWSLVQSTTVRNNFASISPFNNQTVQTLIPVFGWTKTFGIKTHMQISTDLNFQNIIFDTITNANNQIKHKDTFNISTIYYWRIRALHSKDTMNWIVLSFKTFNGAVNLYSPANFAINQDINIGLSFEKYNFTKTYILEYDTGKIFNQNSPSIKRVYNFKQGISPSFLKSDTLFNYATTYVWRVKGVYGSDTSLPSTSRVFTTIDKPTLHYPDFNYVGVGTFVEGLINPLAGSSHVLWELDTNVNFNSPHLYVGKDTHVLDNITPTKVLLNFPKALRFETQYFWRAKCISKIDSSDWSLIYKFTPTTTPWINSPANNSKNITTTPTLIWGVQGSVNDYIFQYQISTDSNFIAAAIVSLPSGNSSSAMVSCLPSTKYYWRARAYHIKDTSQWTPVYNFTTVVSTDVVKVKLISPANNTININATSIPLEWHSALNAETYTIQISNNSNFSTIIGSVNSVDTILDLNGLTQGNTYYWRVRGFNDNKIGPWSDIWKFNTNAPTTISYFNDSSWVNIYPNPSSNSINVNCEGNFKTEIYNALGQLVFSQLNSIDAININTIDFTEGIYLIVITTGKGVYKEQIIINH